MVTSRTPAPVVGDDVNLRRRHVANERGLALAIALLALVVTGALITGSFFIGVQEQRMAENMTLSERAFAAAEGAANDEFRVWRADSHNARKAYPQEPLPITRGRAAGTVYKLNRNLYAVDLTAIDSLRTARGRGARRRLLVLGRIRPLELQAQASLTTRGSVSLQGNAQVDGSDHTPNTSWTSCAPPDTTKAGIRTPDANNVTIGGNASVRGEPRIQGDPSVNDSTFTLFGDVTYADLAGRATLRFGSDNLRTEPVVVGGVCDRTVRTNWGDGLNRLGPCGTYFPIVHVAGNLTLNSGQGQGILLVDGDLNVQGSYEWFGVVVVKGSLKTAGGGASEAHFWGMVMAANVDLELQNLSGNATLNYSKCAVIQALEWTGMAALVRSRGFVQLN
jgi:hypothetical protein